MMIDPECARLKCIYRKKIRTTSSYMKKALTQSCVHTRWQQEKRMERIAGKRKTHKNYLLKEKVLRDTRKTNINDDLEKKKNFGMILLCTRNRHKTVHEIYYK